MFYWSEFENLLFFVNSENFQRDFLNLMSFCIYFSVSPKNPANSICYGFREPTPDFVDRKPAILKEKPKKSSQHRRLQLEDFRPPPKYSSFPQLVPGTKSENKILLFLLSWGMYVLHKLKDIRTQCERRFLETAICTRWWWAHPWHPIILKTFLWVNNKGRF